MALRNKLSARLSETSDPPIACCSEIAIDFSELGHSYGFDRWLFRGYHAQIRKGRVFAVLGPNGRGKSTLLKILLGALEPTEGRFTVSGRIGFVPQIFQVSFPYRVLDMVLMGRARHVGTFSTPSLADEEIALAALEKLGLLDLAHQPFDQLSGGQRQLVIFARALATQADILMLDEPTSALDLKNQSAVLDKIQQLSRDDGFTVVFTTHHPHHARAVADDALLMLGERDYVFGSAREALTEAHLEALYQLPMRKARFEYMGQMLETLVPVFQQAPERQTVEA